jgi:dTDP-3-amino-3,4,6-trideoxy-alpha-D-glucose transaminase
MIQANDFRRQWEQIGEDVARAAARVGESGWYILGREVEEFEKLLARVWGLPYATGVASGLDAIEISLRVLGLKRGDKVATTPISAFATTLAIVKAGGIPVFVDCDDSGLVRLDLVEQLAARDTGVRFLVPVHLYGFSLNLDHLAHLGRRFELQIVEDCAQSILAAWGERPTGSVGQMAATSFYPTKNLGAMGDGGAILTSAPERAEEAAFYRDYGQRGKYRHTRLGYNSRLDELQAAILKDGMLPRLAGWTARRGEIARAYTEGIRHPGIRVPRLPPEGRACYHLFPVFVNPERKEDFREHLRGRGIGTGEHYPLCIFEQDALGGVDFEGGNACENARILCRSEVSLPIHPFLTDGEVLAVIDACAGWEE